MREHLNDIAPRRVAVLDPVKLVIDNYPDGQVEECHPPNHPQKPDWGRRAVPFSRELWIEREDFMEAPGKGYFRLFPGNKVRLRYGFVVECTGCDKDAAGRVMAVHCTYFPDSKSGTPGSDTYKVKGNIHWVSARHAYQCEVRLFDRLFTDRAPGRRRARLHSGSESGIEAREYRATGTRVEGRAARSALSVRASRLLYRRPQSTPNPARRYSIAR